MHLELLNKLKTKLVGMSKEDLTNMLDNFTTEHKKITTVVKHIESLSHEIERTKWRFLENPADSEAKATIEDLKSKLAECVEYLNVCKIMYKVAGKECPENVTADDCCDYVNYIEGAIRMINELLTTPATESADIDTLLSELDSALEALDITEVEEDETSTDDCCDDDTTLPGEETTGEFEKEDEIEEEIDEDEETLESLLASFDLF